MLVTVGRNAGGPNAKVISTAVLEFLRVPFPQFAQAGPMPCEQHEARLDGEKPDLRQEGIHPDPIFTGRYESEGSSGGRYFWAINQAGRALIAIRTIRNYIKSSQEYRELRGDLQADGTAVLFQSDNPQAFWGYLQLKSAGTVTWSYGSYLGPDGRRVFADADASRDNDEVLQINRKRPTMMESLFKSDDKYLNVLLQQREWYPLTTYVSSFLEDGASSNVLRLLLQNYRGKPGGSGVTYKEKEAKAGAAARIVNFLGHLLWDGQAATKPDPLPMPPELEQACGQEWRDFVARTFKVIPHGHHNNLVLATHVAKVKLARRKVNNGGVELSFLDWLIALVKERIATPWPGDGEGQARTLSKLLYLSINPSAGTGTYQYHLKLDAIVVGFYLEGTMLVERLTSPKWKLLCDVRTFGRPHIPTSTTVFDVRVETAQEWTPDDFEGTLVVLEADVSAQAKGVKVGITLQGSYLHSKNGMVMGFENADASAGAGRGGKLKVGSGWDVMYGFVTRKNPDTIIDLSNPYPGSKSVMGSLGSAIHFCFDSALLTPAARQFLRLVCADRLAALTSPDTKIMIIGHTDRPGDYAYNQKLSEMRAKNVRTALGDILDGVLPMRLDEISAVGLSEAEAIVLDLLRSRFNAENVKTPEYRRVDLLIDYSVVASFRPQLTSP